jgi:very-short-patch-repair endonuclease
MTTEQRQFAREQRKQPTQAEHVLWQALRGRKFHGLTFRRQVPLLNYTVDFMCFEHRLIVELDGAGHAEQQEYDARRTNEIESQGFEVLRFANDQILNELQSVFDAIDVAANLHTDPSPPTPLPFGRGERSAP